MKWCQDLEIAKIRLFENNLTLSIVKSSKVVFESRSHGIGGFLEAIEKSGDKMMGASVADKVVGKAVALLCVYAGVRAVYAGTLSIKAKTVFERNGIYLETGKIVDKILDRSGREMCPFEKASLKIDSSEEAYRKFKALMNLLR